MLVCFSLKYLKEKVNVCSSTMLFIGQSDCKGFYVIQRFPDLLSSNLGRITDYKRGSRPQGILTFSSNDLFISFPLTFVGPTQSNKS